MVEYQCDQNNAVGLATLKKLVQAQDTALRQASRKQC